MNTIPQDKEIEKCLLGSLLIDKNAINKISSIITKDDFYVENHKRVYKAIEDIYNKGEDVDIVLLNSLLKDFSWYNDLGGISYLIELTSLIPTASHIISYAKAIRKYKVKRDLIDQGQHVIDIGSTTDEDEMEVCDLIDEAQKAIFSISDRGIINEFSNVEDCIGESIERIKNAKTGKPKGVPTGFIAMDKMLSGLQKSDLIVLAARPGAGKSVMAMDIARHAAIREEKSVAFFSLEMSKEQLIDRFISSEAQVNSWNMRNGDIQEGSDEFCRIKDVLTRVHNSKLFINDTPSMTVFQMRSMARKLKAKNGLDLIVVDYLQLIQPSNPKASEVAQMSEISRQLKIMAKELNVPVLALSQLSRAVESRMPAIPRLSDLRSSGSIEQDADIVIFIYREEMYKKDTPRQGSADIIIAKHRNGALGTIDLCFSGEYTSFSNGLIRA
ncbi:MAG: replicative DNA helicase [Clostridia bacterium]|jgi:replicative DNA helicase|nr:replicative DNA helicase [Clostridia bacterium]